MALDKEQLKVYLTSLFDGTLTDNGSPEENRTAFVNKLADIIDGYVRSIAITYTGGLTAPGGAVGGVFNNIIE